MRVKHFVILSSLILGGCNSDPRSEPSAMATSAKEDKQVQIDEVQRRIVDRSRALVKLTTELTEDANDSANIYAQEVQMRLQKEQAGLIARNGLIYSGGAAGARAQVSDEEGARNRAVSSLKRAQRILEAALALSNKSTDLQKEINGFEAGESLSAILELDADVIARYAALIPQIETLRASRHTEDRRTALLEVAKEIERSVGTLNGLADGQSRLTFPSSDKIANAAAPSLEDPNANEATGRNAASEKSAETLAALPVWTAAETRKINAWFAENSRCRGGSGDDPETEKACESREGLMDGLHDQGICYGMENQSGAEMDFHRCQKGSLK